MQIQKTQQGITLVPSSDIEEMKKTIGILAQEVSRMSSTLQEIKSPKEVTLPPAPDLLKVTISDLASIANVTKMTIERRVKAKKLPKPQTNPYNGYKFWYKKDLPKDLHSKIDLYYFDKTSASR